MNKNLKKRAKSLSLNLKTKIERHQIVKAFINYKKFIMTI